MLTSHSNVNRLVTTHYILDVCSANYVPRSWDARDMWHPRLVYTIIRDAIDIEKLMCICPAWGTARKQLPPHRRYLISYIAPIYMQSKHIYFGNKHVRLLTQLESLHTWASNTHRPLPGLLRQSSLVLPHTAIFAMSRHAPVLSAASTIPSATQGSALPNGILPART